MFQTGYFKTSRNSQNGKKSASFQCCFKAS